MSEPGGVLARTALALVGLGLVVAVVLALTEGVRFPGVAGPAAVSLEPAAAVGCAATGPYHAPDPGSMGLPPGLPLCATGPLVVTEPGTVLDGLDVRGGILVDATDVVVRRSRITGDGAMPFGVRTAPGASVRIEDTTLTGDFPAAAVGGDRWSGERIEITRVTHDGAHLGDGARLRNSIVHDFRAAPGVRANAVVLRGLDPRVEDNRIELDGAPGDDGGSAVLLSPDESAGQGVDPLVIRGNVLGGGRHTVEQDPRAAEPSDLLITGNRFLRDAEQGPLRVSRRAVLSDNAYVDGGPLPRR